ncbi:hypothetical protein DZG01_19780 [Pseudomonas fluorescens]|nr:hypothetical protein DZG01_19780 [Pseudomonas fluorescens]
MLNQQSRARAPPNPPMKTGGLHYIRNRPNSPCGSEPARDDGVSVDILGECQTAIASRLAPTGFPVGRVSGVSFPFRLSPVTGHTPWSSPRRGGKS